jgi:hypothetical protein
VERERTERDRTGCATHGVVVDDRPEELDGVVDPHAGGHTAAGEPFTVADEEVAVASGDVVEVDVDVEWTCDGAHVRRPAYRAGAG